MLHHHTPHYAILMRRVCYALIPAVIVMSWQFGIGILVNLVLASVLAVLFEALLLYLRRVSIIHFVGDGSAIVSAWLLALAMPPCTPWWLIVVAVATAIVIAKQLYGGFGNNVFNPAMVAYALSMLAFPQALTHWQLPPYQSFFDITTCMHCLGGETFTTTQTSATPLTAWRFDLPITDNNQTLWLYPNIAFLLGGLWLLYKRVITWHIPVSFLAALGIGGGLLHLINDHNPTLWFYWLNGATMIGAFFIATDPVTAPQHKVAMLIFGGSIGLLLLLFRHTSANLDGLAFATLLMNMCSPLMNRCWKKSCQHSH